MNATMQRTRASLLIVLIGGTVGWFLFVAGTYFDMVVTAQFTDDELYGDDPLALILPSRYFVFGAIASLAFASLIAKRRLVSSAEHTTPSRFHGSVLIFTNVALIITLALSALAGLTVFMSGFFDSVTRAHPIARLFDVYVPIVLYTALLVGMILAGFVFLRQRHPSIKEEPATPAAATPLTEGAPRETRTLALAYAVPIIAAAIALIIGLIVYDITQTALEVWIWVIIVAIVATGITAGMHLARHASGGAENITGSIAGAVNLNFVLSVVSAVIVTMMGLGYGTSATNALRSQVYVSLSVYSDTGQDLSAGTPFALESIFVQVNGSDLERSSPVTVTLDPDARTLIEGSTDREGFIYLEQGLTESTDAEIPAGDHTMVLDYTSSLGTTATLSLNFTVTDDARAMFSDGTDAIHEPGAATLMPVTFAWVMSDLLPAFLLWLAAMLMIYFSLGVRGRTGDHALERGR